MKVPRICTVCLNVVPAHAIKYGQDEEENRKLDIIDAQTRCTKCNGRLTRYIHKVIERVEDQDVLKLFGITGSKVGEAKEKKAKYDTARKETEAQFYKDIENSKRR